MIKGKRRRRRKSDDKREVEAGGLKEQRAVKIRKSGRREKKMIMKAE